MGCNCKNVKKIQNLVHNANDLQVERKGASKILFKIVNGLQNFFIKIFILLLLVCVTPIVFIIITFNLFFQGKPTIPMPKKIVEKLIRNKDES